MPRSDEYWEALGEDRRDGLDGDLDAPDMEADRVERDHWRQVQR